MAVNFRPSPCYQWCHFDQCFLSRKQFLILCISYSLWSCHSRAGTSIFGILYWPWTTSECCSCFCEYFCGLSLSFIYINFQSGHTWIAFLHQCKIRSWDCLQVCLTSNLVKLANSITAGLSTFWPQQDSLVHLLQTWPTSSSVCLVSTRMIGANFCHTYRSRDSSTRKGSQRECIQE